MKPLSQIIEDVELDNIGTLNVYRNASKLKQIAVELAKACENQHAVWVGDYKDACMSECGSTCRALTKCRELSGEK